MTAAPARKISRLSNIELTEISLVDRGANPGAKVMLFKRDDREDEEAEYPADELAEAFAKISKPETSGDDGAGGAEEMAYGEYSDADIADELARINGNAPPVHKVAAPLTPEQTIEKLLIENPRIYEQLDGIRARAVEGMQLG